MTFPYSPDNAEPVGDTPADGVIAGAALSALNSRNQENVTALISERLSADQAAWPTLFASIFQGLDDTLPLPVAIVKAILDSFLLGPLQALGDLISGLLPDFAVNSMEDALGIFGAIGDWLWGGIGSLVQFLSDAGTEILENVITFFTALFDELGEGLFDFLEQVAIFFKPVWESLGEPLLQKIVGLIESVADLIDINALKGYIEELAGFFTGVLNVGAARFVELFKTFGQWFNGLGEVPAIAALLSVLQDVVEFFQPLLQSLGVTIWSDLGKLFTFASNLLGDLGAGIFDSLESLVAFFQGVWTSLSEPVLDAISALFKSISDLIDIGTLQGFIEDIAAFFTDVLNIGASSFVGLFKNLFEFFDWLWDSFGGAAETFLKPLLQFFDWLWNGIQGGFGGVGGLVDTFVKPLVQFLDWLWNGVQGGFAGVGGLVETFLKPFIEFLNWLWNGVQNGFAGVGGLVETFLKPFIEFLDWLWNGVQDGFAGVGDLVATFLKPFVEFLDWAWNGIQDGFGGLGGVVETFLKPVIEFLNDLWDVIGEPILRAIGDFFSFISGLIGFPDLQGFIANIVNFFTGFVNPAQFTELIKYIFGFFGLLGEGLVPFLDAFGTIITFFQGIGGQLTAAFLDLVQPIIDFFGLFLSGGDISFGFAEWITGNLLDPVVDAVGFAISGLNGGVTALTNFFSGIISGGATLVDSVIKAVVQAIIPGALGDWTELRAWAENQIDSLNIGESLKGILAGPLSIIPVSFLNEASPNLLTQGDFRTASTINAADGWSWDSSTNADGTVGGSAKVVCDGSTKNLYTNQAIDVGAGDVIRVSAQVKSLGLVGAGDTIFLALSCFDGNGNLILEPVLASQAASATFVELSGTYTVPIVTTMRSVKMRLAVTATAGEVWWDDVFLSKTGLMGQSLVTDLPTDLSSKLTQSSYLNANQITAGSLSPDRVIDNSLPQAKVASLGADLSAKLTQSSNLNASQLLSGSLSPDRIVNNTVPQAKVVSLTTDLSAKLTQSSNLNATQLTSGSLSPDRVVDNTLPQAKVVSLGTDLQSKLTQSSNLNASQLTTGNLSPDRIVNNTVPQAKVVSLTTDLSAKLTQSSNLNASQLTSGSLSPDRVVNNTLPQAKVVDLPTDLTSKLTQSSPLNAAQLQSGTVPAERLPAGTSVVGSGVIVSRSGNLTPSPAYYQQGGYAPEYSFYNSKPANTTDIEIFSDSNSKIAFKTLNAGWYMVEIAFLLNLTGSSSSSTVTGYWPTAWQFWPAFTVNNVSGTTLTTATQLRYGSSFLYETTFAYPGSAIIQSSFIAYCNAGQAVQPKYIFGNNVWPGTGSQNVILGSSFGTYFGLSLLNRSLA